VKQKKNKDGLGKPTSGEYAGEAAKEFLKVLEAVAQEIPVPGVGAAVKIATNLIKMCEVPTEVAGFICNISHPFFSV